MNVLAQRVRLLPRSCAFRSSGLRPPGHAYGESNIHLSPGLLLKRNVSPRRTEGIRRACAFTPRELRFPGSPVPVSRPRDGDRVSTLKFLQVQKRNVSPRQKGLNRADHPRYGTVVSRARSPVPAGKSFFFHPFSEFRPCFRLGFNLNRPPRRSCVPHCPDSTVSPTYTKHIEPRGISRSGFKLQGPTDPPLDRLSAGTVPAHT